MVFVHGLGIGHAAEDAWRVKLCNPDQRLDDEECVCYKAEYSMWRLEVRSAVRDLVIFDDNEAGDQTEDAG